MTIYHEKRAILEQGSILEAELHGSCLILMTLTRDLRTCFSKIWGSVVIVSSLRYMLLRGAFQMTLTCVPNSSAKEEVSHGQCVTPHPILTHLLLLRSSSHHTFVLLSIQLWFLFSTSIESCNHNYYLIPEHCDYSRAKPFTH